jgi:hypothetical protein
MAHRPRPFVIVNPAAEVILASHLAGGERLLWSGRPKQGVMFRASDAFQIPFSVLWCGFAVSWEYSVLKTDGAARFFFNVWGILFVAIGVYMVIGRFFVDAKQRANTVFGVTDERILIVSGVFTRMVKSLNLRTLSDISLVERADGTGTISFGPTLPFVSSGRAFAIFGTPTPVPEFEAIADARAVYETIRRAQASFRV